MLFSKLEGLDLEIVKTKRKSLSIQIDRQGKVSVRAPIRINEKTIYSFIEKKQDWIFKTIEKQKTSFSAKIKEEKPLEVGKIFLFGEEKEIVFGQFPKIASTQDYIFIPTKYQDNLKFKKKLKDFYKTELENYLFSQLGLYTHQLGLDLAQIQINLKTREYKTKWGHCQYKHIQNLFFQSKKSLPKEVNLAFNIKLAQFPKAIVDYVLVHELCHIYEANHSKNFWDIVLKGYPDYKVSRKWLKSQDTGLVL